MKRRTKIAIVMGGVWGVIAGANGVPIIWTLVGAFVMGIGVAIIMDD